MSEDPTLDVLRYLQWDSDWNEYWAITGPLILI